MEPRDLTYKNLEDITNCFSEEHKVGSGGYGHVYKGVLDNGTAIAIKKLHEMAGLDDTQFKKEFNNLMRVKHKNIIRLIAYCYETQRKHLKINGEYVFARVEGRALCFEYMQRGSLDKYISDEPCGLDWHTCYKIIKGTCEGLDYLHNGSKDDRMYHLDLKPGNILLDYNMMPKIADFGLSRLFGTTKTHITKTFAGTKGYMPPEYIDERQISKKFDLFSLGVIIIEIMAGTSGYYQSAKISSQQFIEHVQEIWKKRLQATSNYASQEADSLEVKTCIEIALRCVEADRAKRPTIEEVIHKLNEIETTRKTIIDQMSECTLGRLVIDPLELRFPFEVDRDLSCVLQLTNKSGDFLAFSVKTNQSKYSARPDRGVMPPWSKRYVVATLQAQGRAPANMQCDDLLLVQNARVATHDHEGTAAEDLESMMSKAVDLDEKRLPIVYIPLPPPSSG